MRARETRPPVRPRKTAARPEELFQGGRGCSREAWPRARTKRDPGREPGRGEPSSAGYYAIALRKENEQLAADIDAALDRLAADGTLRRIYEKWGLWNARQEAFFADRAVE